MISLSDKLKAAQNIKSLLNANYENSLQDLIHTGIYDDAKKNIYNFLIEIELTEENLNIFEQAVFALGEYYSKTKLENLWFLYYFDFF